MEAGHPEPPRNTEKPNDHDLEIYRQEYETFRHFDKLRWQAPSIPLAIAAGFAALLSQQELQCWFFTLLLILFGIVTLLSAYTMRRIGRRVEENHDVLKKVATKIGDKSIDELKGQKLGATKYFEGFLWVVGFSSIAWALFTVWPELRSLIS